MNCDKAQRYAVLAESGEIGSRNAARLAGHLACCAACRLFSAEYVRLAGSARDLPRTDGPGPETALAVKAQIRRSAGCGRKTVLFPAPALTAIAAGLLVAAATAWMLRSPDGSLARVMTAHSAVAVLTDGTFAMHEQPGADHSDALRRLAMDILKMEGLSADVALESDVLSQLEEPIPTDPLSRSMRGCPEGIRG